jgi:hypothetical protein
MLRRYYGPGITFLIGLALSLLGVTNRVLGFVVIGVSVLWTILVLPFVSPWLPTIAVEHGDGIALRFRGPDRRPQGKRKLRQETQSMVRDIHQYIKTKPSATVESLAQHQATSQAMQGAKDEAEKQAIWNKSTMELITGYEKDKQELAEHFGGRMHYLIGEYKRRKLLSDSDASLLEWQLGSKFWLAQAGSALDALARRL